MMTVRYIGAEKTRQIWGRWLAPGEIVAGGIAESLALLADFEIVDTTLTQDQAEAVATVDESED